MRSTEENRIRIALDCPDRRGVVARVSGTLSRIGATILDAQQHLDPDTEHFFMRYVVEPDPGNEGVQNWGVSWLRAGLDQDRHELGLKMRCCASSRRQRVALLATKASHCLVDVLQKWRSGELPCEITCVIANHREMGEYAEWYGVPFHHVDFKTQTKVEAFARIESLLDQFQVELTVLARFMQVIPSGLIRKHPGRMINIHHSFLPSFVGAKPYHQAYERGVKLIGATCHYVTEELDEGPIIEQEVIRVTHMDGPDDLRRKGRMCEREALSRGLRLHLEDRVFIHGNKTVVFSD